MVSWKEDLHDRCIIYFPFKLPLHLPYQCNTLKIAPNYSCMIYLNKKVHGKNGAEETMGGEGQHHMIQYSIQVSTLHLIWQNLYIVHV